jgi:hypothetical protein
MIVPNQSVSMHLIKNGEAEQELVYVNAANNKWKSPGEGWLGPQAGVWTQMADGLRLMDPANKDELAFCRGLSLEKCYTLEQGNATYLSSGGAGKWEILGVFKA